MTPPTEPDNTPTAPGHNFLTGAVESSAVSRPQRENSAPGAYARDLGLDTPGGVEDGLVSSARHFMGIHDYRTAERQWSQALSVLRDAGDHTAVADVLWSMTTMYCVWPDLDKATTTCTDLVTLYNSAADHLRAVALYGLGAVQLAGNRTSAAVETLTRADELMSTADPSERELHADLLVLLGRAHWLHEAYGPARTVLHRAHALLQDDRFAAAEVQSLLDTDDGAPFPLSWDDERCDPWPALRCGSTREHLTRILQPPADCAYPLDVPNAARVWDCLAGGSRNTAVDRELAERIAAVFPAQALALSSWQYQYRTIAELIDRGISQFLDLGCGLLTHAGVHEIAEAVGVGARTVYVDIDPVVVHATTIHLDDPTRTVAIRADIRDPAALLAHPDLRAVLDLDQPIAILAFGVLDTIADIDQPGDCVTAIADAFATGSYLAISHLTDESASPGMREQLGSAIALFGETGTTLVPRDTAAVSSWLTHLEVLAPGIGMTVDWRPDHPVPREPHQRLLLGAVARTTSRTDHPTTSASPVTDPHPRETIQPS